MSFLTVLGILISVVVLLWIMAHPDDFQSDDSAVSDFQLISRSSPPQFKRINPSSPRDSVHVAGFHAQRKQGDICWRTGLRRHACSCGSCKG